ncbi:hypothetical protein DMX06_24835 [Pseudomonas mosselii]|nr:hypothetical protein DMX06_24835 [Pseudomonas mosselii]
MSSRERSPCGSGLVSRKGRRAAPAVGASTLRPWGRCAPLSRHKAAPTRESASHRLLGKALLSYDLRGKKKDRGDRHKPAARFHGRCSGTSRG